MLEVWGVFYKILFSLLNRALICTICYLFLINSNPVINCSWIFGSTVEDLLLLSLLFFILRAERGSGFSSPNPRDLQSLPWRFPCSCLCKSAGPQSSRHCSGRIPCARAENPSALCTLCAPNQPSSSGWTKSPSHAFVHKVTPGILGCSWPAAAALSCSTGWSLEHPRSHLVPHHWHQSQNFPPLSSFTTFFRPLLPALPSSPMILLCLLSQVWRDLSVLLPTCCVI